MKDEAELIRQRRAAELATTSPMYRGVKEKAFAGTASPRAAIKAFCLHCTGDMRNEIRDCTSYACPLREYRPYQNDAEDGSEDATEGEPS